MMTTRFSRKIQSTILIASVLMISACAYIKTDDPIKTGETIANKTDETTRITLEKGKFETPPEIHQTNATKVIEQNSTTSQTAPDTVQATKTSDTRITQKEPFVNVRTAASTKSRIVAVLKKGHSIEVLETKDSWVKISWHKGDAVKQGWIKKMFVEGTE